MFGQQVWRKLHPSGQIIHSIFDLDGNRIAEYDYAGGSSTLIREYIWMNGLPVAVVENGVVYYVRTDHIGRPVFATDAIGTKVWEATYYPFGEVFVTSPIDPINLRFPGQWFQAESGLHQNWMRDYDPTTGRYLQADPLGLVDGASVYGYAGQNPRRYVDPRGEHSRSGFCDSLLMMGIPSDCARHSPPRRLPSCGPASSSFDPDNPSTFLPPIANSETCDNCEETAPEPDCDEEWRDAIDRCIGLLTSNRPPRGMTGGHNDIYGCAKGFVPEICLGNEYERDPNK